MRCAVQRWQQEGGVALQHGHFLAFASTQRFSWSNGVIIPLTGVSTPPLRVLPFGAMRDCCSGLLFVFQMCHHFCLISTGKSFAHLPERQRVRVYGQYNQMR